MDELDDKDKMEEEEEVNNVTPIKQMLPVAMYPKTPKIIPKALPKDQETVSFLL